MVEGQKDLFGEAGAEPTKRCGRCFAEKPRSAFWRSGKSPDGLGWQCQNCDNEARAERRHGGRAVRTGLNFFKYCPICELWKARSGFYMGGRYGYCKRCAKDKSSRVYQENREAISHQQLQKRRALRLEMVAAYGGQCTCCGERRWEFLSIEHVNGGGGAHRRQLKSSNGVLKHLKKRGWPKDGFTVLCFNCNCSKGRLGACAHQRPMAEPDYTDPRKTAGATKHCPRCGEEKPRATAFHRTKGGRAAPYCKACAAIIRKSHRLAIRRGDFLLDGPPTLGVLRYCPGCRLWKVAREHFNRHCAPG